MKTNKEGCYHPKKQCEGTICCFHNPSKHHMIDWQLNIRLDRGALTERICPHGIGHPDPDSLVWLQGRQKKFELQIDEGIHGCDGCCSPKIEVIR
jgi:hypothetical protein